MYMCIDNNKKNMNLRKFRCIHGKSLREKRKGKHNYIIISKIKYIYEYMKINEVPENHGTGF